MGRANETSAAQLFTQMFHQHRVQQAQQQDFLMDPGPIICQTFSSFALTGTNGATYSSKSKLLSFKLEKRLFFVHWGGGGGDRLG